VPFRRGEGRSSERGANENDEGGAHTCLAGGTYMPRGGHIHAYIHA
jgi:hypothetical protein